MSLDERLASTDPKVKLEAEQELIQNSRKSGNEVERIAAVKRITNKEFLLEIALKAASDQQFSKSSKCDTTKDGLTALEKLTDNKDFVRLASKAASPVIRLAALEKVSEVDGFTYLAQKASDVKIRSCAFAKVTDEKALAIIAKSAPDPELRLAAYKKIQTQDTLFALMGESNDQGIIVDGIGRVTDKAKLLPLVFKDAPSAFNKAFVDAFIASCSDDTVFAKVVKEYGQMLLPEQCVAIMSKTKNMELQRSISDISDKKIINKIKKSKNAYSLFEQVHSLELRRSFFAEMFPINGGGLVDTKALKQLLPKLHDDEIIYFVESRLADLVIPEIPQDRIFGLFTSYLKRPTQRNSTIMRLFFRMNESDTKKAISMLPKHIEYSYFDSVSEKIKDPEFIERCLLNCSFDYKEPSVYNNFRTNKDVMKEVRKRLRPNTKKKLCIAARKKAESMKGKAIVFGPFYLGMPYMDAILLSEEIFGDDDSVAFEAKFQKEGSHNMGDFGRVWKVSFNNRAKFKFMDCEDSAVLSQFIHQFIKNGAGKVGKFRYADEVKREFGEDDDRLYESYSNTKHGIKVQYCPKDGVLNMIEL